MFGLLSILSLSLSSKCAPRGPCRRISWEYHERDIWRGTWGVGRQRCHWWRSRTSREHCAQTGQRDKFVTIWSRWNCKLFEPLQVDEWVRYILLSKIIWQNSLERVCIQYVIFFHKLLPKHIFILLYPEADRLIFGAMFWQLILSQIFWGPTKWLMAWSTVINGSLNIVRKFKFIDGFNWEGCQKDPFSRLLLLRSPPPSVGLWKI